jgi:hypothetical protein
MKIVHADASYQSDVLEKARVAVLLDLGSHVPMTTFEDFLKYLAPPQPRFDLGATIRSLKSGTDPVLTSSNKWSMFPDAPKDSKDSEDTVFRPMPEIFTKVVAAIIATSRGRLSEEDRIIDFLQNPSRAPTSNERHNESRPDGYFLLKHRKRVMNNGKEVVRWDDVALSCEYKLKDGNNDLDDARIHPVL